MRSRLERFRSQLVAKVKSPWGWAGLILTGVWWLVDDRWNLASKANKALDEWAFPIIPGLVSALLLPVVVVVGFVLALIGHAYWMSLRMPAPPAAGDILHAVGTVSPPPSTRDRETVSSSEIKFTRDELIEREEYRNYLTQQLGVAEDIRDENSNSLMKGVFPNKARESKWVADTYYGLKDRNLEDAALFGHPDEFGSLDDRVQSLHLILDAM